MSVSAAVHESGPAVARERPPERAFLALVRTIGLLERVMQPQFARFGVSGSQWAALRALQRAQLDGQESLRITDLSERLLIRPPSVTGVIDRLERNGLVSRDTSPDDLRTRHVRLTAGGQRLLREVNGIYAEQVERALGGLGSGDQQELHHLLERLCGHLEKLATEPTAQPEAAAHRRSEP